MTQLLESPASITFVRALALTLPILLGYAIAFGLISIVNAFLHAFFHFVESTVGATIGWIPGVGKWVKGSIESAEHKATGKLGDAAHNLEGHVADAFHALSNQIHSVGHEIYGLSIALWQITHFLHSWGHPAVLRDRLGSMDKQQRGWFERTKANARNLDRLRKSLWGVGAALGGVNVGAWLKNLGWFRHHTGRQIHALQGGYTLPHALPHPGIDAPARTRAKDAGNTGENLWDRINDISRKITLPLSIAIVATAIGKMGAGWFRCSKLGKYGTRICNIDDGLFNSLLLGTTAIFGSLSIVTLAEACLAVEEEVVGGILKGFSEFHDIKLP